MGLEKIEGIESLSEMEAGYFFSFNRYKVNLNVMSSGVKSSSTYYLDIDGMFLGEDVEIFYRQADELAKAVKGALSKECG